MIKQKSPGDRSVSEPWLEVVFCAVLWDMEYALVKAVAKICITYPHILLTALLQLCLVVVIGEICRYFY